MKQQIREKLALLGGEIELLSTGIGEAISYAQSGDVRILGITGPERLVQLPDTPTLSEMGTPLVFANWRGLFAAPGTGSDQVQSLQQQIRQGLDSPAWQSAMTRYGWTPLVLMGDAFTQYLDEQATLLESTLQGRACQGAVLPARPAGNQRALHLRRTSDSDGCLDG